MLVILYCVFVYSQKKLLFGQNKYIWDDVEGEKYLQRWKTVNCNLCICVRAKEITAIRLFPTLSVDAVNQRIVSRPIPTQVKCKIPGIQRWGSARDTNVPSPRPPESWLLIISHRTSDAVGIVSSCPYSVFFDTTTAAHHSPIMYQIDGRGTTTHSELRLPSRQLRCRRGCSSSPHWRGIANCLIYYPTYSYVEHNPQQPHSIRQHVVIY
jgi:hypothetical protein